MSAVGGVNYTDAKATAREARRSKKIAGVTGARDRVENLNLRANFNHGNFIHGAAARRLLASYMDLDNFRNPLPESELEVIRAMVSQIVVVQATLVGLGVNPPEHLLSGYRILADNIERAKLPVVVFGLGAHVRAGAKVEYKLHADLLRLIQVFSAHSENIAVRGEFTAESLRKLGISNVKVIGCQSLFWHRQPTLSHLLEGTSDEGRPTAFNFTRANVEYKLINQAIAEDFDLIGQGMSAEEVLLQRYKIEGEPIPYTGFTEAALKHNLVNRERYESWVRKRFFQFSDVDAWVDHMRRYRASYGTRFHGNMSAYLAGVPALWITHDTRTEEMCELFRLPAMRFKDIDDGVSLAALYERMDYSECAKIYPERFQAMVDYLNEAEVNHTLLAQTLVAENEEECVLTVIQLRNDTAYNRYPWIFRAVAIDLSKHTSVVDSEMRILSFGCSKGDEVFALADKYFPEARILGVDVATDKLQMARLANNAPERLSFELSTPGVLESRGPFHAIFAMSVLCAWPGSMGKDDITDVFSFAEFEAVIELLDHNLALNGLLAIYNGNYRFRDTRFWANYELVPVPMANSGFVSKFDKNCRRQPEFDSDKEMVFRKVAETKPN